MEQEEKRKEAYRKRAFALEVAKTLSPATQMGIIKLVIAGSIECPSDKFWKDEIATPGFTELNFCINNHPVVLGNQILESLVKRGYAYKITVKGSYRKKLLLEPTEAAYNFFHNVTVDDNLLRDTKHSLRPFWIDAYNQKKIALRTVL